MLDLLKKYQQFLINFARVKRSQFYVFSSTSRPERSQNGNIIKQTKQNKILKMKIIYAFIMVSRQKFQKIMKKYSLGLWAVPKGLSMGSWLCNC